MNIFKKIFKGMEKLTPPIVIENETMDDVNKLKFHGNELNLATLAPDTYKDLTFLVVDDNINQLDVIGKFLQNHGAEAVFAENGQLAVELFFSDANRYDMILMDIQMPLMNGYEAIKKIRTDVLPKGQSIPIIAISGNLVPSDAENYQFTCFLQKPFRMEQLAYIIGHIQELL